MATSVSTPAIARSNARNAVAAGFLGWTFDAFDFFVLVFVLPAVAKDFGRSIPELALTMTLATRPIGAVIFGLLADRYGRRPVLIANIAFYSLMEVLSGLAPSYAAFLAMRLLYGIGMGGTWGVGASLVLESVPPKWRGVASGLLLRMDVPLGCPNIAMTGQVLEREHIHVRCPPREARVAKSVKVEGFYFSQTTGIRVLLLEAGGLNMPARRRGRE